MQDIAYIGLDLETSGSDPDKHQPIEIGLAHRQPGWGGMPVGISVSVRFEPGFEWDEEAAEVHGIALERATDKYRPPIPVADGYATYWAWSLVPDRNQYLVIPVGWNVGSFDMTFVRKFFPLLASRLSYRSLDLNSLVFALADGDQRTFKKIKGKAKDYAKVAMEGRGEERVPHSARSDAMAALFELEFLRGYKG